MARLKSLDAFAAYLAMRHAQDQDQAIAAQLAVGLYPLWKIMQFNALDASTVTWLHAAVPLVERAFYQSQRVTAVFTQNARFAVLPTEDPLPIAVPEVENPHVLSPGAFDMPDLGVPADKLENMLDEFDIEHVADSLTTEANYKTKKAMPGPEDELMQKALVRTSGDAIRNAIDGSRGATQSIVRRDRKVLGYARVTDSNPCGFCALLASHGVFYDKNAFSKGYGKRRVGRKSDADFAANPSRRGELPEGFSDIAKVHNNCRCTLRPVWTKASGMDAAAEYWLDAWNKIYDADPYATNKEMVAKFDKWHRAHPWQGVQFDLYALDRDLAERKQALLDAGFDAGSPQVKWAERMRQNLAA